MAHSTPGGAWKVNRTGSPGFAGALALKFGTCPWAQIAQASVDTTESAGNL
jgi:hypothetical protein